MNVGFGINKLSLKWKIFAFLLGFCALLLIILWLFQTVFLSAFYRAIRVSEIKRYANTIANNIDHDDIIELIAAIFENDDAFIETTSLDGHGVYPAASGIDKIPIPKKLDLFANARKNGGEYLEYSIPPQRLGGGNNTDFMPPPANRQPMRSLVYVKLVERASGEPVAILIDAGISPINATVKTLRHQLYYVTCIMLVLSIVLAFIIAKRVSKPIEEINKSAKILSRGDYTIHFNGKGFREIGELSDTLNTAAAELNKVETLRQELMANISHDLRTPLSLIYSYAEMMHDFPNEITPEQTQTIMDETKRLTSLVNDALAISNIETGIQRLDLSSFNLTLSILATVDRMMELTKKNGYQIRFDYDREAIIHADEVKVTQAFYNLLINAINYTGDDKSVSVRQTITGDCVKIEVSDTGEGINEENLPYVWDRYYKVDKKHKRAITGTGLGLSIVKKVIDQHSGSYGVDSQVGEGSTFWFCLKRQKE